MKRKLLAMLAICLVMITPMTVIAAPEDATEQSETVTEISAEGETSGISQIKTDENPGCISIELSIPSGFGYDVSVEVYNTETGVTYTFVAKDVNQYTTFGYVPYGDYIVSVVHAIGDNTMKYPFTITSETEFTLSDMTQAASVTATIDNYNDVLAVINDYKASQAEVTEEEPKEEETEIVTVLFSENVTYPTAVEGVYMDAGGKLYYNGETTSDCYTAYALGNASTNLDILMTVTEGGVLQEAKCSVSLDGGQTITAQTIIKDTITVPNTGITLYFNTDVDTNQLQEGDTFHFVIPQTHKVTTSGSVRAEQISAVVTGTLSQNYEITLEIIASGELGTAKYCIKDSAGQIMENGTVPEDGVITYQELSIHMRDGAYTKGNKFAITAESSVEKVPYVSFVIIGCILAGLLLGGYVFLSMKKEKPIDYKLKPWIDRQDEHKYE